MIQSRGLAIDVAARRVLSDASFTVNTGDKVGLVGRNGAGKTSLLKVLAGADDATAGLVLRRGTLGYVPQNPRPRAEAAHSALSHILSWRGHRRQSRLGPARRIHHEGLASGRWPAGRVPRHLLAVPGRSPARGEAPDLAGAPPGGRDREVELAGRGDAAPDGQTGEAGEVDLHPRGAHEGGARGRPP